MLLAHQDAGDLVHAALDVQRDRFELHAVFADPRKGPVQAQGEQGQQHVFQAQQHIAARAQLAFEACHLAHAHVAPHQLEHARLTVGAGRCRGQQQQKDTAHDGHKNHHHQPQAHALRLAGEQCERAARQRGQQGAHRQGRYDEHRHRGQPDLDEIHVHGLPAARLGAQVGAQHQQALVVVFKANDAQQRQHQTQRQQGPHGRGEGRQRFAHFLARQARGRLRHLGRQGLQPEHHGHPHQRQGKHRPAGGINLAPAGGELQAQAAPARGPQAKTHGTGPDEGRQHRASQQKQRHRRVLPRLGGNVVGHGEQHQHHKAHHHLALLRSELQRTAGHHAVVIEILGRAPACPGGVETQRENAQQHIHDPHAEIFAATAREFQGMGLDALQGQVGGQLRCTA